MTTTPTQQRRKFVVAVIPSRFASTRFSGKPLVDLLGVPMVVRVARRAKAASRIDDVWVATDHEEIARVARGAGFVVKMTPSDCSSGTDRVRAAFGDASAWDPETVVVNLQGDEPLVDPADIDALVDAMKEREADMVTLARPMDPARFSDPHAVKVVRDARQFALYFSRAPIPHGHAEIALLHVGMYAFSWSALVRFAALGPTALERAEGLEQLRALEHGFRIRVADARSVRPSFAIDTPDDVARVVEELKKQEARV